MSGVGLNDWRGRRMAGRRGRGLDGRGDRGLDGRRCGFDDCQFFARGQRLDFMGDRTIGPLGRFQVLVLLCGFPRFRNTQDLISWGHGDRSWLLHRGSRGRSGGRNQYMFRCGRGGGHRGGAETGIGADCPFARPVQASNPNIGPIQRDRTIAVLLSAHAPPWPGILPDPRLLNLSALTVWEMSSSVRKVASWREDVPVEKTTPFTVRVQGCEP